VQYGLMHFIDQMNQTIPIILKVIEEDLGYAINIGDTKDLEVDSIVDVIMERRKDFKNLKGHMTLISLLLAAVTSQLMKTRIVNGHFLETISNLLKVCEPSLFLGADEFTNAVLAIVESISGNQKTLFNNSLPVIQHILPTLMNKLRSDNNDVKFMSLKIFTDIIIQYIYDETIFDPSKLEMNAIESKHTASEAENMCKYTTEMINEMLIDGLLPRFKYLLDEEDPVPLFALKLLSALTDRSDHFVLIIEKLDILPIIADYYSFGHKRLNQHTIKVIKNVIDSQEISLEALYNYDVIPKTFNIIDSMLEQHQVCYSDTLIDILHSIIDKVYHHCELLETVEGDPNLEEAIEGLVTSAFSCIELLDPQYDLSVIDKSSQ
jgi:serine/threonine-protein kinase ULK4